MDALFIGVLTGIVLCFIAYKYIQMRKKKEVNEPKQPSNPNTSDEIRLGDTWEKPPKQNK